MFGRKKRHLRLEPPTTKEELDKTRRRQELLRKKLNLYTQRKDKWKPT